MDEPEILSRLLYRDALMLVLNKPAGLPVHKGTGGGETLEAYFEALRFGLPRPPALAHRLDKDTSGCLILGRNRHALNALGGMFKASRIGKTYWAVVQGVPQAAQGRIDLPLARQSESGKRWWMKVAAEGGLPAATRWRLMGSAGDKSWLELEPETGRTHQLRVHLSAIGHPIVGDRIYGAPMPAQTLHLHARAVEVPLYDKKPAIRVQAPAPAHMLENLVACGYAEKTLAT